jgi:hypothetical protein
VTGYVLDTDVVIALRTADVTGMLSGRGPFPVIITDIVWDELSAPGDRQARNQKYAQDLAGEATPLDVNSAEAATLLSLQAPPVTEGAGEHSVIAYCHHHPGALAVLQDQKALRRAIEELPGRVLSFHGLLKAFVELERLDWTAASVLATAYRRQYTHSRLPIWWPES